jgi:hypothetical protein
VCGEQTKTKKEKIQVEKSTRVELKRKVEATNPGVGRDSGFI